MAEKTKKRYYWLIPLAIGIIVGIIGISMIVKANSIDNSNMFDNDWFANSVEKNNKRGIGIFLTFLGFLIIGVFGSITTYIATIPREQKEKYMSGMIQKQMGIVNSFMGTNPINSENSNNIKEKRYCKYCGCLIEQDKTVCSGCGAKVSK